TQIKADTFLGGSLIGNGEQITNLNNAHLPPQIDLTQGDTVTGTQVKATQIKADTFLGGSLIGNGEQIT
ncbi:hypothetical protein, partial [uncultured Shewanella sp.]|uniref:hypothetical protein n=1 Tax=uncultured Shewanella sp. TaxID=173975 RepID=UPI00262472DA